MKTALVSAFLPLLAFGTSSLSAAALSSADLTGAVEALVDNHTLQAVSLGVIQAGASITAHLGTLAPDNATPPDDGTLYEIGSITKVFTALLLAESVVRGEVTLDTTVATLLPEDVILPDGAGARITLRMLATHTSGMPRIPAEIPADNFTNPYATYAEADLWTTLRRVKLDFDPGTKGSYSNLGAGLLGTLLARRAGMSFPDLLAERITRALGMVDTAVVPDAEQRARLAPPFTAGGERWSHWDFQALAGAGGIRSTLPDMLRFATALLQPDRTPLSAAMALAWPRQEVAGGVGPGGMALGWMLAGDGQTRWHNGMTGGFHAAVFINLELGIATVLLANRSNPVGTDIAGGLVRRAAGLPERAAPNRDRAEVALTAAQLDRCTGTFRLTPQFAMVIERRNLALFVTPTGQTADRLSAASPDTFFSRRVPAELVFEFSSDGGPATALTLKQGGREMRAPRE